VEEEQQYANFYLWLQQGFSPFPARMFGYSGHIYMQPSLLQAGTDCGALQKKQCSGSTDTLRPVRSPEPHNHIGPVALPREEYLNATGFSPFFTCSSPLRVV